MGKHLFACHKCGGGTAGLRPQRPHLDHKSTHTENVLERGSLPAEIHFETKESTIP